jgi:hypothetical protein
MQNPRMKERIRGALLRRAYWPLLGTGAALSAFCIWLSAYTPPAMIPDLSSASTMKAAFDIMRADRFECGIEDPSKSTETPIASNIITYGFCARDVQQYFSASRLQRVFIGSDKIGNIRVLYNKTLRGW